LAHCVIDAARLGRKRNHRQFQEGRIKPNGGCVAMVGSGKRLEGTRRRNLIVEHQLPNARNHLNTREEHGLYLILIYEKKRPLSLLVDWVWDQED
jgi:hypothetical protein